MTTTAPPRGAPAVPPPHPRRWAGLAVLSASLLLIVMDITILNVALPEMSAELRPSSVELLWMVDVYALAVSGLLVTAASLGDRWGRRKMLIAGFSIFGLASLGILAADSAAEVIAIRALLGVGGAMIMPSTLSMIRHLFTDPRERATALGVWATMAALGAALGPILGGLLLEAFSWHSAFLVHVPVMAVAIVAALWLLPETRNPRPGRWDAIGTVLSIIGMTALVYTIKDVGENGVTAVNVAAGAAAVGGLGWFVRRCLRQPEPLLDVRLFRGRAFTAGTLVALISSLSVAAMMLLLTQWMQLVQGYSALETGFRLLPEVVGAAVFSPLAPALASRIGARTVLAGGLAVGGIGFLLIFPAGDQLDYWPVAISTFLVGVGMGALAVASAVIMAGAPPERSGSAAAVEETSYELGAALGVALLGSVAAAVYRNGLSGSDLAGQGVTGQAAHDVRESLGGAMEVAHNLGAAGTGLAARAQEVFTTSLSWTSLAGGLVMLTAAAIVWVLTPRDLDLGATDH